MPSTNKSILLFSNTQDAALREALNTAAKNYLLTAKDHRYADGGMFFKLGLLSILCLGFYLSALYQQSAYLFFFCYVIFISLGLLLAINVVHDASHNVFFKSSKANTWLNRLVTIPLGIDPECWRIRHVVQHHPFTNIENYDLDIDYNGVLRQTPFQVHHWFMRYQHYYWPLVAAMTFPAIIWCFDWQDRLGLKFDKNKFTHHGVVGWFAFLMIKGLHVSLAIVLPLVICPQFSVGFILITYGLSQLCASLIFVILILGTHWAKATFYQAPTDGLMPHGSTQHVFNTTLNWRLKYPIIEYWLGGLNLHLTHHIYPGFSHRHYLHLTAIIQQIAKQFQIDYYEITLPELFIQQQIFLKQMGRVE
ncbi:fatty acid desaturase family protein [Snodgrassella communis]|uniref:fatty acid desaturase family protein n=1 Tax=Snodgrassella communis TaxID=2946699 RepID=UPI001EF67792|nr:acyl-CoA desaturase [Snodgrassella communis]